MTKYISIPHKKTQKQHGIVLYTCTVSDRCRHKQTQAQLLVVLSQVFECCSFLNCWNKNNKK